MTGVQTCALPIWELGASPLTSPSNSASKTNSDIKPHSVSRRSRILVFDVLEDRRLLAGLDVQIFQDPLSTRVAQPSNTPAVERVVYLDLNRDGSQQASEPLAISDIDGIARFRNLQPGSYSVRLLGNPKSLVQTTDTQPAPTGSWLGNVGAVSPLLWQTDNTAWFASNQSINLIHTDRGTILQQIPLPGRILSIAMPRDNQGFAIVSDANSNTSLVSFDLVSASVTLWSNSDSASMLGPINTSSMKSLISIGSTTFLRQASGQADSLLRIPDPSSWKNNPSLEPTLLGLSPDAQIESLGTRGLLINENTLQGDRLSLFNWTGSQFDLTAERHFDGAVKISSAAPQGDLFAIETPDGIEVLAPNDGLPTTITLNQAIGPTLFDMGRSTLYSLAKADPTRLLGWSLTSGLKLVDVLFADAGTKENAIRTRWSLGFGNDTLIGLRDGQIYRHGLTTPKSTPVDIPSNDTDPSNPSTANSQSSIQKLAIGVRTRGINNPPVLSSLPTIRAVEDQAVNIPTSNWMNAAADSDGDQVFFVLARGTKLGAIHWSTASGGTYTPNPDVNGTDQIVIQAYDGQALSPPQTVGIQIQAVNDAPGGFLYSGVLAIPEKRPGFVLGNVSIIDPDANDTYNYAVSDPRFEFVGTTLRVREQVNINYEAPGWIDLVLSAHCLNNNDTIQRTERVFVIKDPTPYHNDITPQDVDGDGHVTPLDALAIINYINSFGSGSIQPAAEGESRGDLDVDGDGRVSPIDILIIINSINNHRRDAEGETGAAKPPSAPNPIVNAPPDVSDPLGIKKAKQ